MKIGKVSKIFFSLLVIIVGVLGVASAANVAGSWTNTNGLETGTWNENFNGSEGNSGAQLSATGNSGQWSLTGLTSGVVDVSQAPNIYTTPYTNGIFTLASGPWGDGFTVSGITATVVINANTRTSILTFNVPYNGFIIFVSANVVETSNTPNVGHSGTIDSATLDIRKIINVSYQVNNVLDNGNSGLWALENFIQTLTITPITPTTYSVNAVDSDGTFCTFAGSKSPNAGITQLSDGCGIIIGGYDGTLSTDKPLNPSALTTGIIPSMDMGGTKEMIISQDHTGYTSPYTSWINYFFPDTIASGNSWGDYLSLPNWGWTYTLPNGTAMTDLSTTNPEFTNDIIIPLTYNLISTDTNPIQVQIPGNTTITSSDSTWNGTIETPHIITPTIDTNYFSGNSLSFSKAIEVGVSGTSLNLSQPVEITIPGEGGKSLSVGYSSDGINLVPIPLCTISNNETNLNAGDACYYDDGTNINIWTTHFTTFITYTETPIPSSNPSSGTSYYSPYQNSAPVQYVPAPANTSTNQNNNITNLNNPENQTTGNEQNKNSSPGFLGLTGSAIVNFASSPTGIAGIGLVIIIIGSITFVSLRKNRLQKNNSQIQTLK